MKRATEFDPVYQQRRLVVARLGRAFALADYPREPIALMRVGADETTETFALFGAPADIEQYLTRAQESGQTVIVADLTFEV